MEFVLRRTDLTHIYRLETTNKSKLVDFIYICVIIDYIVSSGVVIILAKDTCDSE